MDSVLQLFAYGSGNCADKDFLGLVPWYHYLQVTYDATTKSCDVQFTNVLGGHSGILLVLLAVVDDLLRIAGVVAIGFIVYAGARYIMSNGAPDETAKAQSTIINALIGLGIAMAAIGLVSFLGSHVGSGNAPGSTLHGQTALNVSSLPTANGAANGNVLKTILSIVLGVLGALALFYMTIGGFRYVTSQGDPQAIEKAKQTVLYALIGLVVAIVAEVIVSFALGHIG
jgi:hypothetical protein